jgi:acetyl-CoA carboxylase, biotin carboxylase subunit
MQTFDQSLMELYRARVISTRAMLLRDQPDPSSRCGSGVEAASDDRLDAGARPRGAEAMFRKVLIANRGEIALRVIRACRELGIRTVAVYSEADRESLHVRFADEDVCIGPPPARESYLNIPRIIAAAEITGADAIHPGYGFLAENASSPRSARAASITFIGPTPSRSADGRQGGRPAAMRGGRRPDRAGHARRHRRPDEALGFAEEIGFPVSSRRRRAAAARGCAWRATPTTSRAVPDGPQRGAERASATASVYVEKYLARPRHIEFQILGDQHGRVIHLGERDCSVQRRHQKLIEEAPSPALTPELRERMGEAAVRGAKAIDYVGAGTIEFLLDEDGSFYFMEMNTRIQVEHPVTEMSPGSTSSRSRSARRPGCRSP